LLTSEDPFCAVIAHNFAVELSSRKIVFHIDTAIRKRAFNKTFLREHTVSIGTIILIILVLILLGGLGGIGGGPFYGTGYYGGGGLGVVVVILLILVLMGRI